MDVTDCGDKKARSGTENDIVDDERRAALKIGMIYMPANTIQHPPTVDRRWESSA